MIIFVIMEQIRFWSRGGPFNNQGAGRGKTSKENEQRIERVLRNYEGSAEGKEVLSGK